MARRLTDDERIFFPQGINAYVPKMAYDARLVPGHATAFSLGTPVASDDDIIAAAIDADAVATTEEFYGTVWTSDSPYGRNLILTISGNPGNSHAIDVYGEDYLRQPIIERFVGASGATAVLYGKKAFYRVIKTRIITAASNAVTAKLGTGSRLGLPFKGDILWAKENDILVPANNRPVWTWVDISAAAVAGGPSGAWITATFPGYVKSLRSVGNMPVGSTTDPVITVELGGTAIIGLTTTVDTSAAATGGVPATDVPTTEGYNANNRFATGDLIEIVVADADSSGAISVGLELQPTQYVPPDITDPQTRTTADPRGTYEAIGTLDGAKQIIVGLLGDTSRDFVTDNGGLHGVRHFGG